MHFFLLTPAFWEFDVVILQRKTKKRCLTTKKNSSMDNSLFGLVMSSIGVITGMFMMAALLVCGVHGLKHKITL